MTPTKGRISDETLAKAHDILTDSGTVADLAICRIVDGLIEERAAYRTKCAEVEELKKALIHISELTSETAGGPWTKDIHNCTRKALEGKE